MNYEKEYIPDGYDLYMRIHRNVIMEGAPFAGVFKNRGNGMSTNWSKYADADKTRVQGRGALNPENYGVLSMRVDDVRSIPEQVVVHLPDPDNQAHTEVEGRKDTEVRFKFYKIAIMVIKPNVA